MQCIHHITGPFSRKSELLGCFFIATVVGLSKSEFVSLMERSQDLIPEIRRSILERTIFNVTQKRHTTDDRLVHSHVGQHTTGNA